MRSGTVPTQRNLSPFPKIMPVYGISGTVPMYRYAFLHKGTVPLIMFTSIEEGELLWSR